MAAFDQLTQDQTELLLQFQDLTGIESFDICLETLGRHNWDLEAAVQDQLNIREGRPTEYFQSSLPPTPPSGAAAAAPPSDPPNLGLGNHSASDQWVYPNNLQGAGAAPGQPGTSRGTSTAVQPAGPAPSGGWIYFLVTFPFRFFFGSLFGILGFILKLVRPDNRRYLTDPVADVVSFITQYEATYGRTHPTFYQGTYSQALADAKRELRFLLVYLHCDDHQDTVLFCRHVLTAPEVISFVNENCLFWACSVTSSEGYRVSQALRENAYPFLALVVLRENRMTVVGRMEGGVTTSIPETLVRELEQTMRANESYLVAARADRNERSFNQTLRQQQDIAYEESLKADREKERRRQKEREDKEKEERVKREAEEEERRQKEEIKRRKIDWADRVPDEPPTDHPEAVRILIKLPNGTRLERRFLNHQSLKVLYYFVFCHSESPDAFEIATNFPKRVLPCIPSQDLPEPPSFSEVGLGKSEVVFVYDLEA